MLVRKTGEPLGLQVLVLLFAKLPVIMKQLIGLQLVTWAVVANKPLVDTQLETTQAHRQVHSLSAH